MEPQKRLEINKQFKKLGHHLLEILTHVRATSEYQQDDTIRQFLKRLEALIRTGYFPVYTPISKSSPWAFSRYPAWFYDDQSKKSKVNAVISYPQQWLIKKLFEPIKPRVDQIWNITSGLRQKLKQ